MYFNSKIYIFSIKKKTYMGHTDWVRRVSVNQDGKKFASGSNDQNIMIWEVEKAEPI